MDHRLTSTNYFPSYGENPFAEDSLDPLCKFNLKETSEFVKSFPISSNETQMMKREGVNLLTQRRSIEAPSTPGRPVFSFSVGNFQRKGGFSSKWHDAEKWLIGSSCHESPAHPVKPQTEYSKPHLHRDGIKPQMKVFAEKSQVFEEKVSPSFQHNSIEPFNAVSGSTDVFLKDKFTDNTEAIIPNFRYSEPSKEGFLFGNSASEAFLEVQHKDVGTEMTPLGSSTTSRCHTPYKSSSPARHNTPASRSGPLALGNSYSSSSTIDIAQLEECHLAKLQLGSHYGNSVTSNWSSREEEEDDVSKSLRHFDISDTYRISVSDTRVSAWEEDDKAKCCHRYQREEAKIQAWVNLQGARAEAQSRKLEVKIEKMRSDLEEKLMKRMTEVHRKAEELRDTARYRHASQIERARGEAQKMISRHNSPFQGHTSCGCFSYKNHHH